MKKILLAIGLVVSIFAAYTLSAQSEGRITYEVKMNMHRNLPPGQEDMRGGVPEYASHKDILVFRNNESLYSPADEDPEEDDFGTGDMQIRVRRPQANFYFNNEQSLRVTQREFFGKYYLINDSIRMQPWKLTDETRTIHGYTCRSASFTDEQRHQKIVAWYTDKLRARLGPESFNTLPGTVLHVDINDGERIITAEKIEFVPLTKDELIVPQKGTKVTEAEFAKIVADAQKRMGGQGGVIIRTN